MRYFKHFQQFCFTLILLILGGSNIMWAQQNYPEVIRTISYKEILNVTMAPIAGVERMKMSRDGSKIVFNTYGGEIYTINTDGTDLTKIVSENGQGYLDITDDGSTIIFAKHFGYEILVYSSSGGGELHIANNLPLPQGGTTGPDIRLCPVIADNSGGGARVYFPVLAGGADVAGVWSVKLDGTDLKAHFTYRELSQQLFGLDGSEYNGNIALRQGLAVSEDGKRLVVGTFNFQAEGHTIAWDATNGLHILTNFASAHGNASTMAISSHGDKVAMIYPVSGESRSALSCVNFDGTNAIELAYHIGAGNALQMTQDDFLVFANGDPMPLVLMNTDGSGRLDIVNSPSLSYYTANPFYRCCVGPVSSVSSDGSRFAFVSALNYNDYTRIWVADIDTGAVVAMPSISNVSFSPDHIVVNTASTSTFQATISAGTETFLGAGFSGFKDGAYINFKGSTGLGLLYDDGATVGDLVAGDGIYTNNNIWTNWQENQTPNNPFTIRFSAMTDHHITVIDVEPFFILNNPVEIIENNSVNKPGNFKLAQNFPNPFNPETTISYHLPHSGFVILNVYDLNGREVTTLVNEKQDAGIYQVQFDGSKFTSGVYIYRLTTNNISDSKKFILIK